MHQEIERLFRKGQLALAAAQVEEALRQLGPATPLRGDHARLLLLKWQVLGLQGATAEANQSLKQCLPSDQWNSDLSCRVDMAQGYRLFGKGQIRESLALLHATQERCQTLGDRPNLAETQVRLGALYHRQRAFVASRTYYQAALDFAQEAPDPYLETTALAGLAKNRMIVDGYGAGDEGFRSALEVAERIEARLLVGLLFGEIGNCRLQLGDEAGALEMLRRSCALLEEIGAAPMIQTCLGTLGALHLRLSRETEALVFYQKALAIAESAQEPFSALRWARSIAAIYSRQGDFTAVGRFTALSKRHEQTLVQGGGTAPPDRTVPRVSHAQLEQFRGPVL